MKVKQASRKMKLFTKSHKGALWRAGNLPFHNSPKLVQFSVIPSFDTSVQITAWPPLYTSLVILRFVWFVLLHSVPNYLDTSVSVSKKESIFLFS